MWQINGRLDNVNVVYDLLRHCNRQLSTVTKRRLLCFYTHFQYRHYPLEYDIPGTDYCISRKSMTEYKTIEEKHDNHDKEKVQELVVNCNKIDGTG